MTQSQFPTPPEGATHLFVVARFDDYGDAAGDPTEAFALTRGYWSESDAHAQAETLNRETGERTRYFVRRLRCLLRGRGYEGKDEPSAESDADERRPNEEIHRHEYDYQRKRERDRDCGDEDRKTERRHRNEAGIRFAQRTPGLSALERTLASCRRRRSGRPLVR